MQIGQMSKICPPGVVRSDEFEPSGSDSMPEMPRARARLDPSAITRAFAPDGLHGATATGIARAAGVAKPTIYANGGSKDAVFLACVEAEVERLLSAISDADLHTRALSPRTRIAALCGAIIDHGRRYPDAARLLYLTARHTSSEVAVAVDAALARLPARLAAVLRHDTTPGCAERVAPAMLGAAAALALANGRHDEQAEMLGDAFASVLDPSGTSALSVRSVDFY